MRRDVVGRDETFDLAWRCLQEPRPVLVEGPAGIGKTVLLRGLVEQARQAGWLVLVAAPTEPEAQLPFAALGDLLSPLATDIPGLPPPQRSAAEVALLSADASQPVDERAIGAAVRSLLDAAIASRTGTPIMVAIDDVTWLDPPSERALRFALRRVAGGLAVLVTCRTEEPGSFRVPLGLDQGPERDRLIRLGLGPLTVAALHQILRVRVGTALSRPLLTRVARMCGGNPLLAIEVARAVQRLPNPPSPAEELPVPASLHHLLAEALAGLPSGCREAVRLAALVAVPTPRTLAAAGLTESALDAAEEAGLLRVDPTGVTFAHPVYAAAVRAGIPPGVRRQLHRRLADLVGDPDERAHHLALCATEPDAVIADALTEAAGRQHTRGAHDLAARLYERAAQVTPARAYDERGRRLLGAARCRFDSGDHAGARTVAAGIAEAFTGEIRAEALLLRAIVAWSADEAGGTAVEAATAALSAAPAGSRLAGQIHAHLALFLDLPAPAREHAQAAAALLAACDDDPALLAAAMFQQFYHEVRAGCPARLDLLERALVLEGDDPSWLAGTIPAIWWKAVDEPERARDRLHRMLDRAVVRGDEPSQRELLNHLAEAELLAGRWVECERHTTAARDLAEQLGAAATGEDWLFGLLDAHRGRIAQAHRAAERGLRLASDLDDDWCLRIYQQLAAYAALCAGQYATAVSAYRELAATVDELGLVEPIAQRFESDWIEACVGAGDVATAEAVFDRLRARHRRLPRPWTTLGLARGRALLDSATGVDPTAVLDALADARDGVPPHVLPLDRARCMLVAGVVNRRARRKLPARRALETAISEFTTLGAAGYADRARAELARVGVRPSSPTDLTPTEERVALLAAQGRTSRSIADELFVSPKTVEANLARVYRKLDISRRAELGAALARRKPAGPSTTDSGPPR